MWIDVTKELPRIGERILVVAWEFGCAPVYVIAKFWQSSLPGQPPKWYLDETYRAHSECCIAEGVRYWMRIPELPQAEAQ